MGYSSRKYEKPREERKWDVHPAWRGIGCFLIILIPIMAWAGATIVMNNTSFTLPDNMTRPMIIQYSKYAWMNPVIQWLNTNIGGRGLTLGQVAFTLSFIVIGFVILAIVYGLIYRVVGPPRYGPLDVPPIKKGQRR